MKVTVRKEAARLAVRHLAPSAAVELLCAAGRTPDLHPDVRATLVGVAPNLLPAEEIWALLESAATDGPEAVRRALLDVEPADLAPAHRSRYGELVARLPFLAEEQAAEQALFALREWAPYAPAAGVVLADACADPAGRFGGWPVCHGLSELARSGLPHPIGGVEPGSLLHGVVERLLALIAAGEPEGGGPGGDLPARRRLEALLDLFTRDRGFCAELARLVAGEPALTGARTDLLVRLVDLEAAEPELRASLRELTAAVDGRPVLAVRVAEELENAHRYAQPLADPAAALAAVAALGSGGGLVEGLLAVALATALGARQDWSGPCRDAVLALRRHPDREVREAAYATDLAGD